MHSFSSRGLIATIVVAGLLVLVPAVRADPFGIWFGDDANRGASEGGTVSSSGASATVDGYEFVIRGVVADSTIEVVALDVLGGAEGDDMVVFGPTFLSNGAGAAVPLKRTNADPANPRSLALQFPDLPGAEGEWELSISGVVVTSRANRTSANPASRRPLPPFTLRFDPGVTVPP